MALRDTILRTGIAAMALTAVTAALFAFPITAQAAEVLATGQCGQNAYWTYDDECTLTITGTGSVVQRGYNKKSSTLTNFLYDSSPGGYSSLVYFSHTAKSLVVEEGITEFEERLFRTWGNLEKVSLPSTLKSLPTLVFSDCYSMKSVTFAKNSTLSSIDSEAFLDCRSLASISIPASVTAVGASAFERCSALATITIPAGSKLKSLGDNAFADCNAIKSADFLNARNLSSIGSNVMPASLSASKITGKAVKKKRKLVVKWSSTVGATKYVLYYKAPGKKYKKATVYGTSKTLTKLTKGKKYKMYVVAYMGSNVLCKSKVVTTAKIKK